MFYLRLFLKLFRNIKKRRRSSLRLKVILCEIHHQRVKGFQDSTTCSGCLAAVDEHYQLSAAGRTLASRVSAPPSARRGPAHSIVVTAQSELARFFVCTSLCFVAFVPRTQSIVSVVNEPCWGSAVCSCGASSGVERSAQRVGSTASTGGSDRRSDLGTDSKMIASVTHSRVTYSSLLFQFIENRITVTSNRYNSNSCRRSQRSSVSGSYLLLLLRCLSCRKRLFR